MVREISERLILHWNYRGFTALPPELKEYGQHVKELYLKYNLLSTLPSWLDCLTNLTNIYLQANSIIQLPESVCCLVNLEVLDVSQNGLQSLPESLGKLTKLSKLVLTGNKLSDLPEGLCHLRHLESLQLSSNCFYRVPSALRYCKALNNLSIDKNPLKSLPVFLTRLPELQYISACGNDLHYLPNAPFVKVKRFLFDNNPDVTHIPYPVACQISRDSGNLDVPAGVFNFSVYGCFSPQEFLTTFLTQLSIDDCGQRFYLNFPPFAICNDVPSLREVALRSVVSSVFPVRVSWSHDHTKQLHRVIINRSQFLNYDAWVDQLEELLLPNNLVELLREGPLGFCSRPACGKACFTAAYPVIIPKRIVRRRDNSSVTLERVYCALLFCSAACAREHYSSCSSSWEREMLASRISFRLVGSECAKS